MAGARKIVHLFDESQTPVSGRKLWPPRAVMRHYFGFQHRLTCQGQA